MLALAMALVHDPRGPAHRRALARSGTPRRAVRARRRARPPERRDDDGGRRAVAQRRLLDREPGRLHGEGRGPLRRPSSRPGRAGRPRPRRVPRTGDRWCWRSRCRARSCSRGRSPGSRYGIMAVGVVLIYRSSRIINLAIAEMGGLAAAVLAFLVINHHVSYWVALPACVCLGAVVGAVIELVVVRRLFDAPTGAAARRDHRCLAAPPVRPGLVARSGARAHLSDAVRSHLDHRRCLRAERARLGAGRGAAADHRPRPLPGPDPPWARHPGGRGQPPGGPPRRHQRAPHVDRGVGAGRGVQRAWRRSSPRRSRPRSRRRSSRSVRACWCGSWPPR